MKLFGGNPYREAPEQPVALPSPYPRVLYTDDARRLVQLEEGRFEIEYAKTHVDAVGKQTLVWASDATIEHKQVSPREALEHMREELLGGSRRPSTSMTNALWLCSVIAKVCS